MTSSNKRNSAGFTNKEVFDEIQIKRIRLKAPNSTTLQSVNFPDKSGTVAITSAVDGGGLVTTDTVQSIVGTKTFTAPPSIYSIVNGLVTLTFQAVSGTVALLTDLVNYVTLSTVQTITGSKTFTSNPTVTALKSPSGFTLTLPDTTTGVLALTSQLSNTSNFVDLISSQSITGSKTFIYPPSIGSLRSPSGFLISLPDTTAGTFALTSQLTNAANFVDLTSTQTISGNKTFSTNPTATALKSPAGFVLTLPNTTTGTLALTSQIPTNSSYVDLTTNQSIGGSKTFFSSLIAQYAGTSPWLIPGYAFIGKPDSGLYFATDGLTYRNVGLTVDGKYISTAGLNSPSNSAFTANYNYDGTFLGGFACSTSTGAGVFRIANAAGFLGNLSYGGSSNVDLSLPTTTGTLALFSQIPTNSTYVDLASTQTISGSKTFSTSPTTTALKSPSGFVLTLPDTTTGTLALFSQIPTNSTYVDLTSTQTISGSKTFSANPTATALKSPAGFILTLPNTVGGTLALTSQIPTNSSYVDLTTNQSVSGSKTFFSSLIAQYAGTSPWLIPGYAFIGKPDSGLYFATDGLTYRNVGVTVEGKYLSTFGLNSPSNAAYFANYNYDGTFLGGFTCATSSGAGFFKIASATGFSANLSYAGSSSADLSLPTTSGALALFSQIPTNSTYVDLTSTQTISGSKTFSSNPTATALKSPSGFILTLPDTASGTLLGTGSGFTIPSGSITLTSGQYVSINLGTAAAPALSFGPTAYDGIFSTNPGNVNIATVGILRATFGSGNLTFATNYGLVTTGTTTITAGTGGFSCPGPFASSLASSNVACSVRPSNSANTGLFGSGSTNVSVAVGGSTIVSCGASGTSLTGTFSSSGVSTLSGGQKIGANGTTTLQSLHGSVTAASTVSAGNTQSVSVLFASSFAAIPNVHATVTNAVPGTNNVNAVIVTVGSITITGCIIHFYNSFNQATTAIPTGCWRAYL